ncbi:toll/interleukin-1 receptor domain-containing protein [bacterium]|nr:toll/interleukin-1 receptor domain-containing protein [bacterium]MBU1873715.1 toll/interleukin-1 receptor domain-containing protein [bacterium]
MAEDSKSKKEVGENILSTSKYPLVFISHDNRDAELAEAFSKLLKSVSAGMLKSFRSSDKKGTEGIEFGDEWYKRLMSKLETASDVVCLFTDRSLNRPWILYEAGVAKGKLDTPVHGIALGIPLKRVSTGPFYQFQNCDDSEESLTKLVLQLARRIPGLESDLDVVKTQVKNFKTQAEKLILTLGKSAENEDKSIIEDSSGAKLFEEIKVMFRDLPSRIKERLSDDTYPQRRKRYFRLDPMMIEEMIHMIGGKSEDPIGILIISSLLKDDFPWLYEIGLETYRTVKTGDLEATERSLINYHRAVEFTLHGPMMEMMGPPSKEIMMITRDLSMVVEHICQRYLSVIKKPIRKPRIK